MWWLSGGGFGLMIGVPTLRGGLRHEWDAIIRVEQNFFCDLRKWVCRACGCRRRHGLIARQFHDLVRHVSSEVGVTTVPLYLSCFLVGEEKTIDHRIGSARSEGASQRRTRRQSGLVADGMRAERSFDVCYAREGEESLEGGDDITCPRVPYRRVVVAPVRGHLRRWGGRAPCIGRFVYMTEATKEDLPRCQWGVRSPSCMS